MTSKRTPDRQAAGDRGVTSEATRRGVLAAGAVCVPGVLFGTRDRMGRGSRRSPRATSLEETDGRRQTAPGEWAVTSTLTADDATPGARFGYSVAIDGDRALVGAEADDHNGVGSGAAYVFELDGERGVQTQKLTAADGAPDDRFGDAVALDEGRALVGARGSDGRGPDTGAAYVFELDGERWVQTQKLTAADADTNDRFGRAVVLDGGRALVGTRLDDDTVSDAGAGYVFELDGERWVQTQKLTAADADSGDRFGSSVALGGDRALVGAERDDESTEDGGAVYAFAFDGGEWRQTQKLTPGVVSPGTRFGSTVALQRATALVGAEHDRERGADAGAVFAFRLEGNRWRQTKKLLAPSGAPGARFGSAVVLGENRALVGAPADGDAVSDGGAVYVFTREDVSGASGGGSVGSDLRIEPVIGILAGIVTIASGVVAGIRYFRDREPRSEE